MNLDPYPRNARHAEAKGVTLVEFLLERIADDEQSARYAQTVAPTPWEVADRGWLARLYRDGSDDPMFEVERASLAGPNPGDLLRFFERFSPSRVLAECDAKRRIIDRASAAWVESDCTECNEAGYLGDAVLRLLALPFSDHPSYRPEWAPENP